MSTAKLALGTLGIYIAYLNISIINQKIFTHQYQPLKSQNKAGGDLFQFADLVLGLSALFCLIYSIATSFLKKQGKSPIPLTQTIRLGVLYTINVATLNFSLYYIPYPVRVVGDKLGYLTAVIVGVFFSRIGKDSKFHLGTQKIIIAIMITIGTLIFAKAHYIKKQDQDLYNPDQKWIGYLLLLISVTTEALFSDSQAYAKVTYKPTMNQLMYSVNSITVLITLTRLIYKGQVFSSIQFCMNHTEISTDLFLYASLTILGQISIYFVILNFKQHMFPLISTTRKVFTVLLSIYLYNHHVNIYQIIALVLVFGGMIYELIDELYYDLTGQQKIKVKKVKNQ